VQVESDLVFLAKHLSPISELPKRSPAIPYQETNSLP